LNLVPLLQEVARAFDGRLPGVRVVTNPNLIPANIDGDKIRTVLRNLLENAFKYSLPDSRPVDLSAQLVDQIVIIRVRDDGVGIPEEPVGRQVSRLGMRSVIGENIVASRQRNR
jgi:signal transduction histidine kinase